VLWRVGRAGCAGRRAKQRKSKDETGRRKPKHGHLPVLGTFGLAVTRLLVDVNLFAVLRQRLGLGLRATALFLVDADFFLDVRVANWRLLGLVLVLVLVDGGSEGFVCLFVPFPSVCLRLR
jgi:hypothetical protein